MLGKVKLDASVTLIAAGTEIIGNLNFSHQLYINGRVEGDISTAEGSDATVVISATGSVKGDIRVANVVISGHVEGDVFAAGRVELAAKAQVRGNVHYRLMEMQLGALVDGQLLHHDSAMPIAAAVAESAVASAAAVPPGSMAVEAGQSALKPVALARRPPGA